jgi:phosphatidylglycerophosphatase C
MADLALFDFDGTLTTGDTFRPFIYFSSSRLRTLAGSVLLAPLLLGYRHGLVSGAQLRRAAISFCFRRRSVAEIADHGRRFAQTLDQVIRPEALARLRWHQAKGDQVAIVSASLSVYLRPWSEPLGVDLLCSELESKDGLHTGHHAGLDCSGEEKARRVRARYDLQSFDTIYAYGDTLEDQALLTLAHRRYFRWRELDSSVALDAALQSWGG